MQKRTPAVILIAVLILQATSVLNAQEPGRRIKAGGPSESVSVLHKMFPDYDAYQLDFDAYEQKRVEDLVALNTVLYDLTPDEQTRVSSMIMKFDSAPRDKEYDKREEDEFRDMINHRASIAKSLSDKFDVDKADTQMAQEILESSGLIKNQPSIARYEVRRNEPIRQIYPAIEAMIGPERADLAHAQWGHRLMEAREQIAIKSLADTLARPEALQRQTDSMRLNARANSSKPAAMRPVSPKRSSSPPKRANANVRSKSSNAKKDAKSTPARNADSKATKRTTPRTRKTTPAPKAEKPVPLDKWEQYVRDFLKDYECTPEQSHAALSILGELKERARALEAANKKRLDAANEIKDRRERQNRIDALNAPIDRLFDQLKRRLEGMLTTHQRAIKAAAESKTGRKTRK